MTNGRTHRGKRGTGRGRGTRRRANPQQPLTQLTDYDREVWQATARILAGETDASNTAETDPAARS